MKKLHAPFAFSSCAFVAALALLVAAAISPVGATTGRVWTSRESADYKDARIDHVAVSPEGRLSLAPAVERLAESPEPFLWCVARDSEGRLHAGGGNDGRVIRLGNGKADVVFDTPEVEVHAIAFDGSDRLYVGSSPDGRIYRVENGEGRVFFDPDATYIWALAFDGSGGLLVATGQPAGIFRVAPDGSSKLLLESREDHIRTLAPDGKGGFLAGSDGGGVIYTIDPDGKARVLFDSPEREISSLAVSGGQIFAAALTPVQKGNRGAARSDTRGNVTTVRVTAEGGSSDEDDSDNTPQETQGGRRQQPQERFTGSVYVISDEGYARRIWTSTERLPLALLPAPDAGVLVGTDGGRILALSHHGDASEVASVESEQVNALVGGADGVYAATSNLGAIFRVSEGHSREGTVVGGVRDAGFTSRWGAITWDGPAPAGTEVRFEVRTGDTEEPDATWADWSGPYREARGGVITSPPARFLQWRATLTTRSGDATPEIRAIHVHYMPENMPPVLESVEVLDPGIWLQSSGPVRGARGARGPSTSAPKRSTGPGMRSVQWTASDDNQDPLEAAVLFKAEDETVWRPLESGIEEGFFAWDSRAMPDGLYRLRVVASDAPGNPPGEGLSTFRESAAFEVDNTPPSITSIKAGAGSRSAVVSAVVSDSFSVIGEIAYSVDAGEWVIVLPEDGVADSTTEPIRFTTEDLGPGEHSIVIRATDRSGNTSAGKAVIRLD
jgi:hypothetical protein